MRHVLRCLFGDRVVANRRLSACLGVAAAGAAFMVATSASAASLQQVNNWGITGLPSDVSMYVYVPDKVVTNPPILTLIHYCGGTASAVFGQAQGGGLVQAADQYGFIMVVPSSGRCWDIVSNKTRQRDGGGDSQAIRQMVKYAVEKYKGNPDRVYATGDSSGGMMTELLLAVYPDVFKAGSAFAGMPAGCRGSNETGSGGGYSNACAGGSVTHTPQEWGDIARSLYPGYTGRRPRVQLFHGDADSTIKYPNFTEAIKEWTNVLSLNASPTTTDTTLTLGTHQAKRQTWKNSCGFVALDAFTSINGDHGPSDTLFVAKHVIPFLGLDKAGPVDPEVEQCSSGGAAGAGAGGSSGSSQAGAGGSSGLGGSTASAGSSAGGVSAGGTSAGGTSAGGTSASTAGTSGAGGQGNAPGGGNATAGASPAAGGSSSVGGAPANAVAGSGGRAASSPTDGDSDATGCSCKVGARQPANGAWLGFGLLATTIALSLGRSRRGRARRNG